MIWIQYVFLSSVFPLKFGCSDLEEPAQNFFPRLSINEYPSARQSGRVHERQRRVRRVLERLCVCGFCVEHRDTPDATQRAIALEQLAQAWESHPSDRAGGLWS